MLAELSIANFAIIGQLHMSFGPGLTVLTGETGAGKSIIIDAIGLLVGGRGSSEWVRHGTKKAEIEGLFFCENPDKLTGILEENGIVAQEDTIILRREIAASGKSICRINGKLVTLQLLKEIGGRLVDIHGQHEHQALLNEEAHVELLDIFGSSEIAKAKEAYSSVYELWRAKKLELTKFSDNEQRIAHRLDLLKFQEQEIAASNLSVNEEDDLTIERNRLMNYEKTFKAVGESYHRFENDGGVMDGLRFALNQLESLTFEDKALEEIGESIRNSYYGLEDASYRLRDYYEGLEFDPIRLDEVEDRLATIRRLQKKYGVTIADILAYFAKITEEIGNLQNKDGHIEQLRAKVDKLYESVLTKGKDLTKLRKKIAGTLETALHEQLKDLYMEKAQFSVRFQSLNEVNSNGLEKVAFYISSNPGEPLKPLVKTASGGEVSRVMLALKAIYSKHMRMTSIIFDEVDTGVSGRVAQGMGEKMYTIANASQVLCITHLPQVAALADWHMYIKKQIAEEKTETEVVQLCVEERTMEVARMISGAEVTQVSLHHAHELLNQATQFQHQFSKESLKTH